MEISNKRVLVVVAHTDDESFGCGGFIKKLSSSNTVKAISFTNGIGARANKKINDLKFRQKASYKASKILGFEWIDQYNYPDNELDQVRLLEIIKVIERKLKK